MLYNFREGTYRAPDNLVFYMKSLDNNDIKEYIKGIHTNHQRNTSQGKVSVFPLLTTLVLTTRKKPYQCNRCDDRKAVVLDVKSLKDPAEPR